METTVCRSSLQKIKVLAYRKPRTSSWHSKLDAPTMEIKALVSKENKQLATNLEATMDEDNINRQPRQMRKVTGDKDQSPADATTRMNKHSTNNPGQCAYSQQKSLGNQYQGWERHYTQTTPKIKATIVRDSNWPATSAKTTLWHFDNYQYQGHIDQMPQVNGDNNDGRGR